MKTLKLSLVLLLISAGNMIAGSLTDDKELAAFKQSYALEYKSDFAKAITVLKEVYKEDSYEINLRLGWLSYQAGQFTQSMTYYQNAMSLKPYSVEAKLGFALPAAALSNWDQVIAQYKKVLEFDAQNSTVNYRLGMIYYGRKDYQTAQKFFERVVNLYPFDYDGVVMLGWSFLQIGKMREAKVLFTKTLLIRPDDASALEGLALIK
jgi:tetratricopeptide (TPR) repeat protein